MDYSESGLDLLDQVSHYEDSFTYFMTPDTGSYYLDYALYSSIRLLIGPIHVFSQYMFIIQIIFIARVIHLLIDVIVKKKKGESVVKQVITCCFGLFQLRSYLSSSSSPMQLLTFTIGAIFLFLFITRHLSLHVMTKSLRHITTVFISILMPILINEYFIHCMNLRENIILRPILMVQAMKASSEILSDQPARDAITTLSYLLHPASIILGPWHPNESSVGEEPGTRGQFRRFFKQAAKTGVCLLKAFVILVLSTNLSDLTELLGSESNIFKAFLKMYFVALEFRLSHYFACYLSSSMLLLWDESDNSQVCSIMSVEAPRSLVEVVVSWNIPMHKWLKEHVFSPLRRTNLNIISTVISTYICSSILHGFKFHIWAVLLTLGVSTWTEYELRKRLAIRYSACVMARPCKLNRKGACNRGHKSTNNNSVMVFLINMFFRLTAILQLAYLGSIFIGNTDEANYKDAILYWANCHYIGHTSCLIMLIARFLV